MRPPGKKTLAIAASAAALGMALPSLAVAAPDINELCLAPPKTLPYGLNGSPQWLATDPDTSAEIRTEIDDPRWANAGRSRLGNTDDATFRVARNGDYLMVSIQLEYLGTPDFDRVYFGVALDPDPANPLAPISNAHAVRISVPDTSILASPNAPLDMTASPAFQEATYDAPTQSWTPGLADTGKPTWIADGIGAWNNNTDGYAGTWGLNFKVDLSAATGLGYSDGSALRLFVGATSVDGDFAEIPYRYPHTPSVNGADTIWSSDSAGMVYRDIKAQWQHTTQLGAVCAGISLPRYSIGVRNTSDDWADPTSILDTTATQSNTLVATPVWPNPNFDPEEPGADPEATCGTNACGYQTIGANEISAQFRVASWGSEYGTGISNGGGGGGGWLAATNDLNAQSVNSIVDGTQGHFEFNCAANTATETCGINRVTYDLQTHQCVLVEMTDLGGDTPFANASQYRNMNFAEASVIERSVGISGLEDFRKEYGVTGDVTAYLYVSKRNMPKPSSESYELPRQRMLLGRLDVTKAFKCDDLEDTCVQGMCAWECPPIVYTRVVENRCGEGNKMFYGEDKSCWCTDGDQACYDDREKPANPPDRTGNATLVEAGYPQWKGRLFFDTERRHMRDGVEVKELAPGMPFGMNIDHKGPTFGWKDDVFGGADVVVTKVREDVYKIVIPAGKKSALIGMTVEATEKPHDVELNQFYGFATRWGAFGSVTMVADKPVEMPQDLTTLVITLDNLLTEVSTGKELVTNLDVPVKLEPLPGSLPFAATFASTTSPAVVMEVIDTPLLGRFMATVVQGANVSTPEACKQGELATLRTAYTVTDGGDDLTMAAENRWECRHWGKMGLVD